MRVNERIRVPEVRVIDENGENLGVLATDKAIAIAKERKLDLVEVAPQASPPVCKIVDFGKYYYQQEKRERKQQHRSKLKEIKFTIKIGEHDFQTKLNRVREFLSDGDMVRVSIFFRGREIIHASKGHELLRRVEEEVKDIARVEGQPMAKGKILQMMVVPSQQT
ncbi:MAG: translation initiation factor IF-3 [Candidatus Bipolaricaulota bacterium]|jgi:translation initiation factor IF-3|nr:translation initiation factor IF-3 [Candidatus Bipolaricaulota bacterium]MCX6100660.1 translation initiation factor IF-3 [Candidatus Bipolaricaulota bacterium]